MSAFYQRTAEALKLNLCAGIRHPRMLKRESGVERLPDQEGLLHPPPSINGNELGLLAFGGFPQHYNLSFTSNHKLTSFEK
jgi:hypothetical protein